MCYSHRLYPYRRSNYDDRHDLPRPVKIHRRRKKGNHHLLLLVHGSHRHIPHPRLRSRASFLSRVSILCRRAMRLDHRDLLVSPRQRIRRLPIR